MRRTSCKALCGLALSVWIALIQQVAGTGCCGDDKGLCYPPTDQDKCDKGGWFTPYGSCDNGVCEPPGWKADPLFRGFDGSQFEFFGRAGANYSVLASSDLAVNMQLVPAGPLNTLHPGGEGTFAGGVATVLPAFKLLAYADEAGNMTFTVNGESVNIELPNTWSQITYEPYVPGVGQTLTVTQTPFVVKIIAVKSFTDTETGYNRGHLDVTAQVTGPVASRASGILGQTLNPVDVSGTAEATFVIPSLDFHRFEAAHGFSRRLLATDLQDYPLHASLT